MTPLSPAQRWLTVCLVGFLGGLMLIYGLPIVAYRISMALERGRDDARRLGVKQQLDQLNVTSQAFRLVSEQVRPAVVHVDVVESIVRSDATDVDEEPRAGLQYLRQAGSGLIIDKSGFVLTNHHVVAGGKGLRVKLQNADERFTATVVGSDARMDLALIKFDPGTNELSPATLGDSNQLEVGDWVLAIGNPFGLDQSVTAGIVSAKGRHAQLENFDSQDLIQTDAAINPGNSGGPLVNLKGEVVGINTFIIGDGNMGIGFAIPSSTVRRAFDDFKEYKRIRRGWLGLLMHRVILTPPNELPKGQALMLVDYCIPDSPAAKGGIRAGDILLELNGKPFRDVSDIRRKIEELTPGDTLDVKLARGSSTIKKELIVQMVPVEPRLLPGERQLGVKLGYNISPELAQTLRLPTTNGILVESVAPDGPALGKLNAADLIVSVNGVTTPTIASFADQILKIPPGGAASLGVWTGSELHSVQMNTVVAK